MLIKKMNNQKKIIIFLLESPLNERQAKRIGVEAYKTAGLSFVVFQCFCEYIL